MPILLASDLHLAPERPERIADFLAWLQGPVTRASALFLLGDIFDYWLGDDCLTLPPNLPIVSALQAVTQRRVSLYIQRGNRDFLLGETFCAATGATLLPEQLTLDLYGVPTVLLHGDQLCTDDVAYQTFRQQVRADTWQQAFLARPLAERQAWLTKVKTESQTAKEAKAQLDETIMDANPQAIEQVFRTTGAQRMIHGHTHRPGQHSHWLDGKPLERWVLGDWYHQMNYLEVASGGIRRFSDNA